MTRPTRWKILYGVALALVLAVALVILKAAEFSLAATIVLALVLLIPGRINGHFWRSFYSGRRLLDSGWNAEAIKEFESFQQRLRENPSLKHLIWFVWSFYSRDIEAMTLNNIGAAMIREGELDQAEERIERAIRIDSQYPVPYYNKGLICELQGDREAAREWLGVARSLGYRQTRVDELANKAASILARIEGRKGKPS